jgi:hypothetical protein
MCQRFYDSLLDARIRLQKALLALNSLPQQASIEKYVDSETPAALQSAQQEALTLFANAFELRKVPHIAVAKVSNTSRRRQQKH